MLLLSLHIQNHGIDKIVAQSLPDLCRTQGFVEGSDAISKVFCLTFEGFQLLTIHPVIEREDFFLFQKFHEICFQFLFQCILCCFVFRFLAQLLLHFLGKVLYERFIFFFLCQCYVRKEVGVFCQKIRKTIRLRFPYCFDLLCL